MFKKGHKHSKNWYKKMIGRKVEQSVIDGVKKAQTGRKHQPQEGYQKGHPAIPGTEKTRFYKGQPSWNKGTGHGTDKIKLKYRTYRANAKKRGFTFDVAFNDFKRLVTSDCFYCGSKATGIDRVDNTLGYINGNMIPACMVCNHMKWNLTKKDFINKCFEIVSKSQAAGYEI